VQQHECTYAYLYLILNFNSMINIIFLCFHVHQNTKLIILALFPKMKILGCYRELLQSQSLASIQVGLINERDRMPVDSWAHCHRLRSLHWLTNQLPIQISTCVVLVIDLEEQPWCYDAMAVDLRAGRCPPYASECLRVAINLPATYKYPMPLYTINRGCGAWWKNAPFISKLSKLLLAF
jgi:hypothetical protein